MTTIQPNVKPDELYQAGAAAAALGINRSTLYRYTQQGIIKSSTRRCNGRQVWKGSELLRCWYFIF